MADSPNTVIIAAYYDHLAIFRRMAANSIRAYMRTVRHTAAWLLENRQVDLRTAGRDDLRAWRAYINRLEVRSVHAYITHMRAFYRWACLEGHRADDPTLALPLPTVPRGLPRPIADEQLELAIYHAPERIRPWLVLAGYAGMRACEIATLHRSRVYATAPEPYMVVIGKGSKERAIPISPYVWNELRPVLPHRGWVFPRRDGLAGPVSAGRVSALCNTYLHETCGMAETLHQLRHRFGTRVQRAAKDLRVTQSLLGHGSPATTQIYTEVANEDAVAAVLAVQPKLRPVQPSSSGTSSG